MESQKRIDKSCGYDVTEPSRIDTEILGTIMTFEQAVWTQNLRLRNRGPRICVLMKFCRIFLGSFG